MKAARLMLLWRGEMELMCICDFGLNCPLSLLHLIHQLMSQFLLWLARKSITVLFFPYKNYNTKNSDTLWTVCLFCIASWCVLDLILCLHPNSIKPLWALVKWQVHALGKDTGSFLFTWEQSSNISHRTGIRRSTAV